MQMQQAKKIPLTQVMQQLGFGAQYTRKSGNEWWYCSPFRTETKPSFKITVDKNTWYDFGMGEGGTIIDLFMALNNLDESGVLSYLESIYFTTGFSPIAINTPPALSEESNRKVKEFKTLQNIALLNYLKERAIDLSIVRKVSKNGFLSGNAFFGELHYLNNNKPYFAIAMKNNSSGYELRCKGFKGCFGKKDISIVKGTDQPILHLFEGYMDWLSLLTIINRDTLPGTTVILNSTALIDKAITFLQENSFEDVRAYFDNDESGQKAFDQLSTACSEDIVTDKRIKYSSYNDLNDFLKNRSQ